jgi:aspartyl-tRNA(Asn)/glutamyl-tRNA(Gln) amidotransferase subunit B
MSWETVIGLEVHIQLLTKSKIFSGASTRYGTKPNTQACFIDLGLPGVLPILNKEAVNMAIKFGLAINAEIARFSQFARKNYFYPDLPKGYQISQHTLPIVERGYLDIPIEKGQTKRIRITRAHLEEDAAKLLHEDFHGMTGVDLNRAGIPLLEIVSEPDMRSPKEAVTYLKVLHALVRYLEICDGNLQEGSFRCDINVSVRPQGEKKLGTRAEIKNLNSFKFVEQAIECEIERQIDILLHGGKIIQETRLYDPQTNETRSMRLKESLHDYRYFPDPDLPALKVTDDMIEAVQRHMPELPQAKRERLMNSYELTPYEADLLITHRALGVYFERVMKATKMPSKSAVNWVLVELSALLNAKGHTIDTCVIQPTVFAQLLNRVHDQTISATSAKQLLETLWLDHKNLDLDALIEQKGLKQLIDTDHISHLIKETLENCHDEWIRYRAGETKLFGFFVGQVMKASKGKANPQQVNKLLKEMLEKD